MINLFRGRYLATFSITLITIILLPTSYSLSSKLLSSDITLPLNIITSFFPEVTQVRTDKNTTAIGKPVATRSMIYANMHHSKKVTITVDQYISSNDALSAFKKAIQKSKSVSGFKPISIPMMGKFSFAGTVTQKSETHLGIGMLENNLIIGVTLAGYEVTPNNIDKLVSLVRKESKLTKTTLSHIKKELQP